MKSLVEIGLLIVDVCVWLYLLVTVLSAAHP